MNTRSITSTFFTCLLWLVAVCAYADDPIEQGHQRPVASIDNLDQPVDLAPYIEYIEDPDHTITFEDIQAGKVEHQWQLNTAPTFIGKNYKSRYWFRVTVKYSQQVAASKPILYIPYHPIQPTELNLWIPNGNGNYRQILTGGHRPYHQRDIHGFRYGFRLPAATLTEGANAALSIVGWLGNQNMASIALLPIELLSTEQFIEEQQQVNGVMLVFYAIMAALLLYNACLFVSLRQPLYGYYLLFLSSAILASAGFDGTTLRFLFPSQPSLNYRVCFINGALMAIFYLIFVWEALDHLGFSHRCLRGFQTMILLCGLGLLHNCLTPFLAHLPLFSYLLLPTLIPLILFTLVLAIRERIHTAVHLFVAEVFALIGTVVLAFMSLGILPINNVTLWSSHGGFLAEALLLSLALAARTRLLQQAAIENLKKYETIYNNSIEGMFQYSIKNDSSKCNPAMATLFGYHSLDAFMADNRMTRLSDATTNNQLGKLLYAEGKVTDFETQIIHQQTQQPVWLSVNMWLAKDNQGQAESVEGTVIDITDKKLKELAQQEAFNTQKELLKANQLAFENLARSDELKNEFLATMSHELRTPMNGISGYLELLKSLECNGDVLTLADSLEHCSADMLRLIDRILDFTQLLAGNLNADSNLLDFTLLLAELDTHYRQRCNTKAITFTFTKEDTVPAKVWGDRKKLSAIINDLLDNAVKYTQAGGIEVVIRAMPIKSISGNSYEIMNTVLVSVRDTGIGITLTDRPKIFKAFSQLDGAFNRKQGGLGLGLAMCHEYIKLMNGTLTLLSTPGNGSRFDFMVDLKVVPNLSTSTAAVKKIPEPHTASKSTSGTILGATILIVEDNPTNQLVLNGILKKLGHTTSVAENGLRALEILANAEFDLILMDCQMPEMDGFEATRAIRSGSRLKDIPIIAVTANVMEGDEQRCLDAGMNDYMKKPIKRELLMEKISQWYGD